MSAYISRDTLREWREACDGESEFHETRILRLIDALEAPCGSCHPCNDWAAETWRQSGGKLPHKVFVDEWREKASAYDALVAHIEALTERWEREATERGPDDMVLTSGVAAMLRDAIAQATEPQP